MGPARAIAAPPGDGGGVMGKGPPRPYWRRRKGSRPHSKRTGNVPPIDATFAAVCRPLCKLTGRRGVCSPWRARAVVALGLAAALPGSAVAAVHAVTDAELAALKLPEACWTALRAWIPWRDALRSRLLNVDPLASWASPTGLRGGNSATGRERSLHLQRAAGAWLRASGVPSSIGDVCDGERWRASMVRGAKAGELLLLGIRR